MTVWAIAMVKDEADVIEPWVRHLLSQVDRVIVADNNSTDETRAILERVAAENSALSVRDDPEPGYYQSAKMSALAEEARGMGASWVVPADADEVWIGRRGTVKQTLQGLPDYVLVAEASLYDYVATARDNGAPNPFERLRWRRTRPAPLPKVAARSLPGLTIHQGNHGVTFDKYPVPPIIKHLLIVRHFPLRSVEHLIRKARNGGPAYEATDLPEDVGTHWRSWGQMTDSQLGDVFRTWYWREDPTRAVWVEGEHQPALVEDPIEMGGG